jgi:hypothetical protein
MMVPCVVIFDGPDDQRAPILPRNSWCCVTTRSCSALAESRFADHSAASDRSVLMLAFRLVTWSWSADTVSRSDAT